MTARPTTWPTARAVVAGAAVWAGACTRDPPPTARPPAVDAAAPAPPAAPLSRLALPLDYDVTGVLAIVERVVPRTFGSLDSARQAGDDPRKRYAFTATRTPFAAEIVGREVRLRTTLAYAARGAYRTPLGATLRAGCGGRDGGAARPRLVVELATPLTLAADWHLRSAARVARVAPASDSGADRCRISVLRYDVTDRVVDAARAALTARLPDIDRRVARVDLAPRAAGWWRALNRPIRLADGVWLTLGPQALRLGGVRGRGHLLTVDAGLDAYPRIVTGPEPRPGAAPLPPLARDPGASGFTILLEGVVDYATASRAVTAALRGRTATQAGRTIAVRTVTVTPAGAGRLALAVAFTGDAAGTLRFVGTPRVAGAGARGPGEGPAVVQVVVPDLDYDLTTDSRLVNAYAWLRSDALRTLFRERAHVPVAPALDRGRALLLGGLNRTIGGVLTLAATVDSVAVHGVYVTQAGLVVQAGASGRARASVRQSRPPRPPTPAPGAG